MRLYLVRHGDYVSDAIDPTRPLSEKGRADVSKIAKFLKGKISADIIWHSTKLRARQTAELIAEIISLKNNLLEKQGLAPNDPVDIIKEDILSKTTENLMIVGHLPFLGKLASLLIVNSDSQTIIGFHQGSVACLEADKDIFTLTWIIYPDLIQ